MRPFAPLLLAPGALDAGTVGTRVLLVLGLLGLTTAAWWLVRRRDGTFRPVQPTAGRPVRLGAADLGRPLGDERTFVQLSSTSCSTCPQVRRVLHDVAARHAGVEHVELLVEDHPLLTERLGIRRTPTVLLLDADGDVLSRESGPLRREQALAALGPRPARETT